MPIHKYARFRIMIKYLNNISVMLVIFLANIVSKILQETDLHLIEENSLLENDINLFENREVVPKYRWSLD